MSNLRHSLFVLLLALSLCAVAACDDGGGDDTAADTAVADTSVPDTADDTAQDDTGSDAADADDDAADVADVADVEDALDTVDVWTDPAIFAVAFLDPGLREVIYMQGARSITIPQVKIRAESISRQPIVGQTVSVASETPGNGIQPAQSVTDAEGLTEPLQLTLGDPMDGATASHHITPYIVPNEPDHIRNELRIETHGAAVTLVAPSDAEGNPVAPVADGGASTWTLTLDVSRADTSDPTLLPDDLELELELITNQGEPALAFASDTSATTMRWPLDPSAPSVEVDLVSTTTEPAQARLFVRLHQLGGTRGQRLETIDVVAAP